MIKNLFFAFLFLVASSFLAVAQSQRFDVNTKASTIEWIGKKVVGSDHKGLVAVKSATFQVDSKKKVVTAGEIVVDMNSISCTDLTDKEWNDKLIAHLKGEDFFDVAKHPTAKFVFASATKEGGDYKVTGTMEIRGKKQTMSFPASINVNGDILKIKIKELVIDRTKFDVKYGSNSFFENLKDKAIADEFVLNIDLTAELY